MRIVNPPAGHDQLSGVSTADHHTKYSDANARAASVEDAAYGAGWDGDATHAPSQNAVYDQLAAMVTTAAAGKGTATIVVGQYTGDNEASNVISGLGITPHFVQVWEQESGAATSDSYYSFSQMVDNNAAGLAFNTGAETVLLNKIIAMASGQFTVDNNGANQSPNSDGSVYEYVAIGDQN